MNVTPVFVATNHNEENAVVEHANRARRSYFEQAVHAESNVSLFDTVFSPTYYKNICCGRNF